MNIYKWPQLLGAAGLAAAVVTIPVPAHTSCISISCFGNGNGTNGSSCTSTLFGFALGIGPNTIATSNGLLTGAVAVGLGNGPTGVTQASSTGFFGLGVALTTTPQRPSAPWRSPVLFSEMVETVSAGFCRRTGDRPEQ